jgi:cytochrome c
MKKLLTLAALIGLGLGSMPSMAADQAAAMELAKKSGCLACHTVDTKLIGPAWKDVGKKYAGNKAAAGQLADKVKKGGTGVWGAIPMPPNTAVKDADIKTLVQFVLSLK